MFSVNFSGYNTEEENYSRIFRPEGNGDYLFLMAVTPLTVFLNDSSKSMNPGDCIIFRPGEMQDYSALRDFSVSFVHFSVPEPEFSQYEIPSSRIFRPVDLQVVDQFLKRIYEEFFTRDLFYDITLDTLMKQLMVYLARERQDRMLSDSNENVQYNLFCQARFTILSNCEKEWASTNMGQMVSLSRSQFYKYYNDFFGVSPMADLQEARIEKAKNLLTNRTLQVTQVAKMCGYASIHHFSRTFKEHCGMSPVAYVKQILEENDES